MSELRRRLDMAEDELTFLKAVFEEYKDSSGELEAELDAQLKDLERSNMALKRENEQIRAQLQATVMRSRKSAEEASNLTTALEAHLEELTKREKKAQSRIRLLEQENEQLKKDLESGGGGGGGGAPAAAPTMSAEAVAQAKAHAKALGEIKQLVFDSRVKMAKLATVTEHRFASSPMEHPIPDLPPEDTDDAEAIMEDMGKLSALLDKTAGIMAETGLTTVLVGQVSEMLNDPEHARTIGLSGQSEEAINKSCLVILGRLMILGETLPEFKRAVTTLKSSLKDHLAVEATEEGTSQLAHTILMLAQDIMKSVFDPMRESEKEDELKKMKNDTLAVIARAREEGEAKARQEAEDRIARERATADQSIEQTRAEIARLKAESEEQLASARTEAKQLAEKARREALEEAAVERGKLEEEIYQSVAGEMDALREALEKSEGQYKQAAMKQQMYQNSMKNAVLDQSKAMLGAMKNARTELETLRRGTQKELAETQKMLNENLNHVRKVARTIAKTDIAQLSMMYERELDLRVKLQDQVQSLRGNIRVFCRIRPLLSNEIEAGESEAIIPTNEMLVTAEDPDDPGRPQSFAFDRVFGPADAQEVVFDEMRQLCLSALDGYNVCLFAYGVTGSGKTFTVEGGERARDNPELHGLVYRTMKELFRIAFGERAGAYDSTISLQLLELYNDDFRDLMQTEPNAPKPEVRMIPELGVVVENVTIHPVTKLADAMELVKKGYRARTTKSTHSNNVSSRSHSILTVHLTGTNVRTKKSYTGKLHFVDLAGSERVGKSGVSGDALEEAKAINKSLSALGDVISALSQKEKFIPYRNSSLTKLLQESLGGNSKTVMICNIAPCKHSMSETVASLRFATRVHKVEMGKATQQEGPPAEVKSIKNKMADLESKFKTGKGGMRPPKESARRAPSPAARKGK